VGRGCRAPPSCLLWWQLPCPTMQTGKGDRHPRPQLSSCGPVPASSGWPHMVVAAVLGTTTSSQRHPCEGIPKTSLHGHPEHIPGKASQIHSCRGVPNKTLGLTLGHWWPPGCNGLEPFWAWGVPSPALLSSPPPQPGRAYCPEEKPSM